MTLAPLMIMELNQILHLSIPHVTQNRYKKVTLILCLHHNGVLTSSVFLLCHDPVISDIKAAYTEKVLLSCDITTEV